MSSKGWVMRKREQFELFARTVEARPGLAPAQPSYKPAEAAHGEAEEVAASCGREAEVAPSCGEAARPETLAIRHEAIRQAAAPSGGHTRAVLAAASVAREAEDREEEEERAPAVADLHRATVSLNTANSTAVNNNSNHNQSVVRGRPAAPRQQQAAKKQVYTQYREMLRRYEQSSRL